MLDKLTHKWLRIPYTLHVRDNERPKGARETLIFIHGIGNSGDAWREVVAEMPDDVRIITIDLLGFGDSPRPKWAVYDAKMQAHSVLATLLRLRLSSQPIIIGHSLGALVAIEIANKYPLLVKQLILCSPPLYKDSDTAMMSHDESLKRMFREAQKHPDGFVRLAQLAVRYNLMNDSFNLNGANVNSYMQALGSMIINQTSMRDAERLKVPTIIIRGALDPFIVPTNIKALKNSNPRITTKKIMAGHEVKGLYIKPLVTIINNLLRA